MSSPHVFPHTAARHSHVMPLPPGPAQASFTGNLPGSHKQMSLCTSGVSPNHVVDLTCSSDDEHSDVVVISPSAFNDRKRKRAVDSCTTATFEADDEDRFPEDFGLSDVDDMDQTSDGSRATKRTRAQSILDADPFNSDKQASMHDRGLDIRRFMASQVAVKCSTCDERLFESKKSLMECALDDLSQPTKVCTACEASRCVGCGQDPTDLDRKHVCENARVFTIWLVLYHLDKTNVTLKVRSSPRKAASRKSEPPSARPRLGSSCLASGVGYGGSESYDGGDFGDSDDEDDDDDDDPDDDEEAEDDTEDDAEYQQAVIESINSHKQEKANQTRQTVPEKAKAFFETTNFGHKFPQTSLQSPPTSAAFASVQKKFPKTPYPHVTPHGLYLSKPVSHPQAGHYPPVQQKQSFPAYSTPSLAMSQSAVTCPNLPDSKPSYYQSQIYKPASLELPNHQRQTPGEPYVPAPATSASSSGPSAAKASQNLPNTQAPPSSWSAWLDSPLSELSNWPPGASKYSKETSVSGTNDSINKIGSNPQQQPDHSHNSNHPHPVDRYRSPELVSPYEPTMKTWPPQSSYPQQSTSQSMNSHATHLNAGSLQSTYQASAAPYAHPPGFTNSPAGFSWDSGWQSPTAQASSFSSNTGHPGSSLTLALPHKTTPSQLVIHHEANSNTAHAWGTSDFQSFPPHYPMPSWKAGTVTLAGPTVTHQSTPPTQFGYHLGSKFSLADHWPPNKKKPSRKPSMKHREEQKPKQPALQSTVELRLEQLGQILPSTDRDSSFDITPPTTVLSMIICSRLLEVLSELLRNDSLSHICRHSSLYHAAWNVLQIMATHYSLVAAVQMPQPEKPQDVGLERLSYLPWIEPGLGQKAPVAKCLSGVFTQSRSVLRRSEKCMEDFKSEDGQVLVFTCRRLAELEQLVEDTTPVVSYEAAKASAANALEPQPLNAEEGSTLPAVDEAAWHRSICVSEVEDETMFKYHVFAAEAKKMEQSPKGRMRHLVEEIVNLETSLPPGIFLRYASSRMDLLKALIIGPSDTPYESGLFEFDILCPIEYPTIAPKVKFKTTGGGRAHFNPNLYNNGKVCLSLLGTWSGTPWKAGESTLLQVLVSIQSMILCEFPWYNEPGRENSYGLKDFRTYGPALEYNMEMQALTTKFAINGWLKDGDNSIWPDLVKHYFRTAEGYESVQKLVSKWAEGNARLKEPLKELTKYSPFAPASETPPPMTAEASRSRTKPEAGSNDETVFTWQSSPQGPASLPSAGYFGVPPVLGSVHPPPPGYPGIPTAHGSVNPPPVPPPNYFGAFPPAQHPHHSLFGVSSAAPPAVPSAVPSQSPSPDPTEIHNQVMAMVEQLHFFLTQIPGPPSGNQDQQ